jgi:type I restriction enzyme, S subunit
VKNLVLGDSLEALIDHRGKTPRKLGSDFVETGVPVASAILVKDGRLDLREARYVDSEIFRRWMTVPTRYGDVLLTSEAPLGRVARVVSDKPLVLGQRIFGLRGRQGILDSGFLYYALQTEQVQSELVGRSTGTTVFGIRQSALRNISIPAPSYAHQLAIAKVLGALDDKITANDLIVRSSLALARATFSKEQRVGSWERRTLAEACAKGWLQLGDGYRTKRSEHGRPGLRILRAGDVGRDSINPAGSDFVSDEFRGSIGPKASQPGDVVLTTKGSVGRVAVVPLDMEQVVYSPQLCYFRVLDPTRLAPGFLSAWFRSDDLQRQAEARMFKSDMAPYINLADIQSMVMPLASPADQHRIGESQAALERAAQAALHENGILAQTRDELLPLLMSGKLRVRDAERVAGRVF